MVAVGLVAAGAATGERSGWGESADGREDAAAAAAAAAATLCGAGESIKSCELPMSGAER